LDAAVVWVDVAEYRIPDVLQSWAAARGLRLVEPPEGGRHAIAIDGSHAKAIEDSLHQSRELLAQHDADGAERALAHAEGLLRAHPELPQAAWLLAEVERGWATRFAQLEPVDRARAERHWRAAAALDGGRAAGVGEPAGAADESVTFRLDVQGAADEIRLDGEPVSSGNRIARPGLHQVTATASGAVIFAQWTSVARDVDVRLALPGPAPCSRADLAGPDIRCPSWVRVRHERSNAYTVQSCSGASCGAELLITALPRPEALPPKHHHFPTWAAWTLGAAGVVAAGVIISAVSFYAIPITQQTIFKTTMPQ
jgi:hypothetical protein